MTLVALMLLGQVQVTIPVPTLTFPAPPKLVVVEPGVQVVEDHDEEVFFTDGYYWHQRDGHWFRNHEHNGRWELYDRGVPAPLLRYKPGAYRHFRHEVREERRDERQEDRREVREDKREGREEKREEKHEKHEEKKHHK